MLEWYMQYYCSVSVKSEKIHNGRVLVLLLIHCFDIVGRTT